MCSLFLYFLCIVSSDVDCCLFSIFVQFYRPLPPVGNPTTVNECHVISYHITANRLEAHDLSTTKEEKEINTIKQIIYNDKYDT